LDRTEVKVINGVKVEIYHGHVRDWSKLHLDMQRALRKEGLVDKRGC